MIATVIRFGVIIAAAVLLRQVVLSPLQCNRAIKSVEERTRNALQGLPRVLAVEAARENIQQLNAVAAGCTDFDLYLLLALNKKILGRHSDAVADLTRALTIADRPEIYFDRALLHLESGRIDAAVADLRIVAEFNPQMVAGLDQEIRARVATRPEPLNPK